MKLENQIYLFIKKLHQFNYELNYLDLIWDIIFLDKKNKWHHVRVVKYQNNYSINLIDGDLDFLNVAPNEKVEIGQFFGGLSQGYRDDEKTLAEWSELVTSMLHWMKLTEKDWVKMNKLVQERYPLNRRKGIIPHALVRTSIKDFFRIDKALGKSKMKKFIDIVESGYFHRDENTTRKTMCANDFFDYCKIAYIAGQRKDDHIEESLSGREMYERYADGRHEGLLDISAHSKKAFADWIDGTHPKKTTGGHPWEIKRGGNTTHIDLYVSRPKYYLKEGFKITLAGASFSRLVETIRMFLAIYEKRLPISINDPDGIRRRLLAQDNIGIMPSYDSLHRANQSFYEHEHVFDVCYFDDFGRYKVRLKSFITWEPLPIFKPKNIS